MVHSVLIADDHRILLSGLKTLINADPDFKDDLMVNGGVFMYRNGTPYDYESIKGITYYYNNIKRNELPSITSFLQEQFGGKEMEKGERIFLKGSREIYSAKDIASLAKSMEQKFKTKAIISLEFQDLSQEELKNAGLPESKLLPIPGK